MPVSTASSDVANLKGAQAGPTLWHLACWRSIARATLLPGVTSAAYVVDRAGLTPVEQERSVTCGVCGDTWLLGVGTTLVQVRALRWSVLVAAVAS